MAATADGGYIFHWKIENVFHWWWLKLKLAIVSPVFFAEKLGSTKWNLLFYPIDDNEEEFGIFLQREKNCDGPNVIEVTFKFAFLDKNGSILLDEEPLTAKFLKNECWGWSFEESARERLFVTDREKFLPEDTLNVRFTIRIKDQIPENYDKFFSTTSIQVKRKCFEWRIDKISNLLSDMTNKFSDYLIACNILLRKNLDELHINIFDFNDSIRHISCKVSIMNSTERKVISETRKYRASDLRIIKFTLPSENLMRNIDLYFPNGICSLRFEFVLVTIKLSECRENPVKLRNTLSQNKTLNDALSELYNEGIFSDVVLRTPNRTLKVHRLILSIRSPFFKTMFTTNMIENNIGQVVISDFDDDTIHRMMLYIYTDFLEDLQLGSAWKLYMIADKYQIQSLKFKCCSFITENLSPTNACDILLGAYKYNFDDLKKDVQDYILRHRKRILYSDEWNYLMKNHPELAVETMYKKFIPQV